MLERQLAQAVLLGGNVARAFRLESGWFSWHSVRGCQVITVPHPSGVNQWFNAPAHRAEFRIVMRQLLGLMPV